VANTRNKSIARLAALLLLCAASLQTVPARASDFPDLIHEKPDDVFLNLGIEAGVRPPIYSPGWQGTLGLRSSLVALWEVQTPSFLPLHVWLGGYTHAQTDWGQEARRAALGVGGGFAVAGLELGAVAQETSDAWAPGIEVAGLLTLGYAGLTLRQAWVRDHEPTLELGMRLNLPIWQGGQEWWPTL